MNDVFRAAHKKSITKNMAVNNPELDLTPRTKRGWNCFQCCFPGGRDVNENGKSEEDTPREVVVEEEEKEEITSRDFDLPEIEESVDEKLAQQPNFVVAFWQLFMTVFFFHFWEGNDKKLTNAPSSTADENKASKKQA